MPVKIEAYTSPTLVLLAFDWPSGGTRNDFLGFAIQRSPGFRRGGQVEPESWLPNRIDFDGPAAEGQDKPSRRAPIQKFLWWDARIDTEDRGTTFAYRVTPVVGSPSNLQLLDAEAAVLQVPIPGLEQNGVGTYFNRAVVSSQAFVRSFPRLDTLADIRKAFAWLANGIEAAVPNFLSRAQQDNHQVVGAIYHFSDDVWLIPAFSAFSGSLSLAYNSTTADTESDDAIQNLITAGHPAGNFDKRSRANISHNKFLVAKHGNQAERLLMGSANFTTAGLTRQANLLHTFDSPQLAGLYNERYELLRANTEMKDLRPLADWSDPIDDIPGAEVRLLFSPEKKPQRKAIDAMIRAIQAAESSVIFCCFMPTDLPLINACLTAGDAGKMMFGLVDNAKEPGENASAFESKIALYHRSRDNKDVAGKEAFSGDAVPLGFNREREGWPNEDPRRAVRIHHKFVLIDAETPQPILYTGSANFSNNSQYNNDENILEIVGHQAIARAYLAEFMRLYEHYRARLAFVRSREAGAGQTTFKLTPDASWARKYFTPGRPEEKARRAMVGDLDG
jgi:phosphatidylserine/phosphatidylglycerophosphate/cardiolipin synthase-like enzyme